MCHLEGFPDQIRSQHAGKQIKTGSFKLKFKTGVTVQIYPWRLYEWLFADDHQKVVSTEALLYVWSHTHVSNLSASIDP